jgi:hypothetical protein
VALTDFGGLVATNQIDIRPCFPDLGVCLFSPHSNRTNMNKNFFAGLFVGLGLLGIFAFRPVEKDKPVAVQKWEYKVLHIKPPISTQKTESEMNALGAEGWELVINESHSAIFKRPIE